jgi:hypothetical protein
MIAMAKVRHAEAAPVSAVLEDLRFRNLVGRRDWDALPARVRARFAKRLYPGRAVCYRGTVLACRMNMAGRLLSQLARLIGAPLPLDEGGGAAAVVTVTEHGASGGQVWTRLYARLRGFPQAIHSAKRFAGPTGLEEYLGRGFGIALRVKAIEAGIRFTSDHYFLCLAGLRLRLPRWLSPGRLTIDHADLGAGAFAFTLALEHPLFGMLIEQHSHFADEVANPGDAQ